MRSWSVFVGAALALPLLGCPPPNTPTGHKLVGKPAPELQVEAVGGDGPKSIAEAKGKVIVVDFWATFCKPCKKSFPKYQELVDTHAGKVFVLAVSIDDAEDKKAEDLLGFGEALGVSFPLLWDKDKKTAPLYDPPTTPTAYVIDKEGVVKYVHAGYQAEEAEVIAKEVEGLL